MDKNTKKRKLGETLPVRLPEDVDRRLRLVAGSACLTVSDALRMAVAHGLPALEAGKIALAR